MTGDEQVTTHVSNAGMPLLLTSDEVATLLRTTRKAVYCMADRGQLPGKTRIGRRVLFRTRQLVDYLDRKCSAPSPKESRDGES